MNRVKLVDVLFVHYEEVFGWDKANFFEEEIAPSLSTSQLIELAKRNGSEDAKFDVITPLQLLMSLPFYERIPDIEAMKQLIEQKQIKLNGNVVDLTEDVLYNDGVWFTVEQLDEGEYSVVSRAQYYDEEFVTLRVGDHIVRQPVPKRG